MDENMWWKRTPQTKTARERRKKNGKKNRRPREESEQWQKNISGIQKASELCMLRCCPSTNFYSTRSHFFFVLFIYKSIYFIYVSMTDSLSHSHTHTYRERERERERHLNNSMNKTEIFRLHKDFSACFMHVSFGPRNWCNTNCRQEKKYEKYLTLSKSQWCEMPIQNLE